MKVNSFTLYFMKLKYLFLQRLYISCFCYIPNNSRTIAEKESVLFKFKENFKLLRKLIYYKCFGNTALYRNSMPEDIRKILWIGCHSDSIGDSLMELSARSLLKNYELHVLASKNNASIFENDPFFKNVYTNPTLINDKYDFLILDYFTTKSIKLKNKFFHNIPFFCINEFLYGPDFNRLKLGYCRIAMLLNMPISDIKYNYYIADQKVDFKKEKNLLYVGISIGGEDPLRTFNNFDKLIQKLNSEVTNLKFILIGSSNGQMQAKKLMNHFNNVENFVGKLSIQESAFVIKQCSIFICCDGGLMHIAQAFDIPIISLFWKFYPEFRLSCEAHIKLSLFDKSDVNNISINQIVEKFYQSNIPEHILKEFHES